MDNNHELSPISKKVKHHLRWLLFLRKKTWCSPSELEFTFSDGHFFCWCEDAQEKLEEEIEKGTKKKGTVPLSEDESHGLSYERIAKEYDVSIKSLKNWTAIKRFDEKEKDEEEREAFLKMRKQ